MQEIRIEAPKSQKQSYVRPELTKHGKVEQLTQGIFDHIICPSVPLQCDDRS